MKKLKYPKANDGSKKIEMKFTFSFDSDGAAMLQNMLDIVQDLPSGTHFDNEDILQALIAAGLYDEETFERNIHNLIDTFNLYCEYFADNLCMNSSAIGEEPFFIRC